MYSVAVLSAVLATASAAVNYDGYKVVRIPTGPDGGNLDTIQNILDDLEVQTWKHPTVGGANVDMMVPPDVSAEFEKQTKGLDVLVLHEDLGADIAEEGELETYEAGSLDDTWFQAYHSYEDHLQWLNDLHAAYANSSEIVVAGSTYEDKNITGIHLWGSDGKDTKPAAVFHGTIHAREWITTMVVEYIVNSLLSGYASDPDVKAIVDRFDIYFFPVANPDGFTFTQTSDRMWRKNRQPHQTSNCIGRDLNRNWPYEWEGEGSSPDPCDEAYRGEAPGDAPETQVHTNFLQGLADANGMKTFIDFHSYSQLFMTPYGYSCSALPDNNDQHQALATTFADALAAVHGTQYTTGPICSTIYQANGNSVDWLVDVAGSETAFAAELRDTGQDGFILPPEQIQPSGEETWAGFKAMMAEIK